MNDAASAFIVPPDLLERPFAVDGPGAFASLAMELFALHAAHNPVYREYLQALRINPDRITAPEAIPCLPIGSFRNRRVLLGGLEAALQFTSSGTTGATTSTHHVPWPALYDRSFLTSFSAEYGRPERWRILALLPAYLERPGSSLVYMVEKLIQLSGDPRSGTWLHDLDGLAALLRTSEADGVQTMLFGVPFALLDLAEKHPMALQHTVIMETGGMKGRRREMPREEFHRMLCAAFSVPSIHSEYGMAELMSQAYSQGDGLFRTPPWMRVLTRDLNDPFAWAGSGRSGGINVIDLANVYSCSFLQTQDFGKAYDDGTFRIEGRITGSEIRGCNLLVQ